MAVISVPSTGMYLHRELGHTIITVFLYIAIMIITTLQDGSIPWILIANIIKWTTIDEVPPPYSTYNISVSHKNHYALKVDRGPDAIACAGKLK